MVYLTSLSPFSIKLIERGFTSAISASSSCDNLLFIRSNFILSPNSKSNSFSFIKVAKDCGTNTADCWDMSGEKSWQGGGNFPTTNAPAFIDSSGIAWAKQRPDPTAELLVDTNGNKKPNQYGKDRVILYPVYYSYDTSIVNTDYKANTVKIILLPDFPNSDWPTNEQTWRCPSMNTHPCYYQSWITGGH